jgi:hypothetical protein
VPTSRAILTEVLAQPCWLWSKTDSRNPSRTAGLSRSAADRAHGRGADLDRRALTQACHPARDFGPRLFTFLAGWGTAAMPGPNGSGFFTVYILAPIVGAVAGGGVYELILRPALPTKKG